MRKVAISVAHSQRSKGAYFKSLAEYPLSRIWSGYVARYLDPRIEFFVFSAESLPQKVELINALDCDLAIEIHFNACGNCGASGCETLYFPGSRTGKTAALTIQNYLTTALMNKDRGVKEGWYKMDRPEVIDFLGDKEGDEVVDYFLRKTNCTALILEPEFIEKASEMTPQKMILGAQAIAEAIGEILL